MKNDWRNVLLKKDSTIREAIGRIDHGSLRIGLVVDDELKLLGVVTDGDIRRGLIKGIGIDNPVVDVMNTEPYTASLNDSKTKILLLMERKDLLHVPIVENGELKGLEVLQHLLAKKKYDNPVFLMAGGFGTRLRPLTNDCPKPLLMVGNKPILETILESFIGAGFHRFYISTHYMPEKIISYFGTGANWGVDIQYIHEEHPLGTGGALGLLPDDLPNLPLILMNADVLTKVDFESFIAFHLDQGSVATMCVREHEYKIPYGVIETDGNKILSMMEKPSHKFFVNAGIYALDRSIIKSVTKNQQIDMPTLLENKMKEGGSIAMFPIHEYWKDIGKMNDFEQAQKDYTTDFA